MTDKQAVDTLLALEMGISGRIHNAITEFCAKDTRTAGKNRLKAW